MRRALPLLTLVLGAIVVARTLVAGVGGGVGLVLGLLLIVAGGARLYFDRGA